ncbi:hypothetical protein QQ008_19180 [Fulvivirgaceae bacterium BMA10]|uniref:DUF1611 domain-containing protein n=1 Tax=Splendidivirga corallicola TaxID=3051826 RepID=A0ABT8KTJ6_9BACT|nr:hypothetical protein [Fulvivirgaceae bacterium BMA10]
MEKLSRGYIIPSAAYGISNKLVKGYRTIDKSPEIGDLVYGIVTRIGQHNSLENSQGRIHNIFQGSKAVFTFGNRYAPDYYEGIVPDSLVEDVDLLARSGLVGLVKAKSSKVIDPTRIKVLGYACDKQGDIINTKNHPLIVPKTTQKKFPRAKMILVVGTAMNSGKSAAAVSCCRALSLSGHEVRGTKVTGTASLKDILHMNDAGASYYADFSYLGYPSTYLLSEEETLHIFNSLDLKYANNRENYWVVELADGINQRETSMLLKSEEVRRRIHKLIFCAADAFGAIGGLEVLKKHFDLTPDAISGVCSSSPLHIKELEAFTEVPIFDSMNADTKMLVDILCRPKRRSKGKVIKV